MSSIFPLQGESHEMHFSFGRGKKVRRNISGTVFFALSPLSGGTVRLTVRGEPLPDWEKADGSGRRKSSPRKTLSLKERENENAGARALLGQLPSFKAAVALIGRLYSRHSSLYER